MMGAIWHWLQENEGRLQRSGFKSRPDMIKKISAAALQVIGERSGDALPDKERAECVEVWTAIGENVNRLKSHWNTDALDYTWRALTHLLPWLNVDVWQWSDRD